MQTFERCRRAYYYQYYGSWEGWYDDAPPDTRKLYLLKNLTTLPMWAGSIVHETIAGSLMEFARTGTAITVGQLQARARNCLRGGWVDAVTKKWVRKPKLTNLQELYYGNGKTLPKEQTEDCRNRVYGCLQAFAESPLLREIQTVPSMDWKPIDKLDSFQVEDVKVWCAIDFSYTAPDGTLRILDWKTGKEKVKTIQTQLACYALFACERWFATLDKLRIAGVFLGENARVSTYPIAPELLIDTKEVILRDTVEMRKPLTDVTANVAREEDFACCEDEWVCQRCSFREACPAAKDKPFAATPW